MSPNETTRGPGIRTAEDEATQVAAVATVLSGPQWDLLEFFAREGVSTLEKARDELTMPKTTAWHHVLMLERRNLIIALDTDGRQKPRQITKFGRLVLALRRRSEGKPLTSADQQLISASQRAVNHLLEESGATDPAKLGERLSELDPEELVTIFKEAIEHAKNPPHRSPQNLEPESPRGGKDGTQKRRQPDRKSPQERADGKRASGSRAS